MGKKIFATKKCCKCRKAFRTSNNSDKCYSCILAEIAPDRMPTEEDKSKAEELSGCMSYEEQIEFYSNHSANQKRR